MDDQLTEWVTAKVSPSHAQKLDELATAARISRSAVIRLLIEHAEVASVASMRFVPEAMTNDADSDPA